MLIPWLQQYAQHVQSMHPGFSPEGVAFPSGCGDPWESGKWEPHCYREAPSPTKAPLRTDPFRELLKGGAFHARHRQSPSQQATAAVPRSRQEQKLRCPPRTPRPLLTAEAH
eukprot:352249-Chlamydomonas_euryale.AAC.9